jgi:hypothetical protein
MKEKEDKIDELFNRLEDLLKCVQDILFQIKLFEAPFLKTRKWLTKEEYLSLSQENKNNCLCLSCSIVFKEDEVIQVCNSCGKTKKNES